MEITRAELFIYTSNNNSRFGMHTKSDITSEGTILTHKQLTAWLRKQSPTHVSSITGTKVVLYTLPLCQN